MADRYWVGGTGVWDATTTTNWSTASGGAGGASAPTSADDVYFDAASNTGTGAFTVTVAGTTASPSSCRSFSTGGAGGALDGAMTLAFTGGGSILDIYENLTWPATNFAVTVAGTFTDGIRFRSTTTGRTITTNGVNIPGSVNINFSGVGGEWTLGSAFTTSNAVVVFTNGTFNTGNFNVSANGLALSGTATKSIVLGSSTVTLSGRAGPISFAATTGFTLNAGTSSIVLSDTSPTFIGGGLTFYNVTFSSAANGTTTISGANTFNNLTQTSRNATGIRNIQLNASQTVSGTLTLGAANTAIRRIHLYSDSQTVQRTITLNGTLATLADVTFRDIATAGTVGTWTGTRLGNAGGVSGVTTDSPKTVYWNLSGTQNWSATGWATTNNGTPDVNNFPLPQDTATFTEAGSAGTINYDQNWWVGDIQMADGVSNRTTGFTLATGVFFPQIYGDITLFSNLTLSGTSTIFFQGQSKTQTVTSAGVTFTQPIDIRTILGTFKLADNFTSTSTTGFIHTIGTVDLNNQTLTCYLWSSNNSNTRAILFGTTGSFNIVGNNTTIFNMSTATNFTYTGTPTVNLTYSGSVGTRLVSVGNSAGGSQATALDYNVSAGSDIVSIFIHYRNLDFTGFTGTCTNNTRVIYGNLTFVPGMTLGGGTLITNFNSTLLQQNLTFAGLILDCPIVFGGTQTYQLQDALTMGSTRTLTFTSGTLDLNDKTLTTGLFSSSNSNTRSILFGTTGNINLTSTGTVWSMGTITNFSYTGTSTVNLTNSSATTRTISQGAGTEAQAVSFYITAGTGIVNLANTGGVYQDIDFTGSTASLGLSNSPLLYGNLLITANTQSSTAGLTFAGTSGIQTVTSNGFTYNFNLAVNGFGGTTELQDAITMVLPKGFSINAGTLDLNDNTLTISFFNSNNANIRSIAFGTLGEINLIGTAGTLWTTNNITNFSVTGTPTVNATDSSAGLTRTFSQGAGVSNQAVSIYVKAGSGTVNLNTTNGVFKTIDLTGFSGTVATSSIFCLGDFVIPAGVTVTSANTIQFAGTDAPQQITTSGNVMDFPIVIGRALTTRSATGDGTTATLTFDPTVYYPVVGQTIIVSGVTPDGYNGTYTVTASSSTSVSYLNATTGAQTTEGTVNLDTTVQLQDALTMGATRQLTFNSGTIDLNNNTLTTRNVSAGAAAPHTILFGTAEINLTGSNITIWNNTNASSYPFTATGTKVINCTYSGSDGSRQINSINSAVNALNFNITAGSDIFSIQGNRQYNNIDFTGFSGTCDVSSGSTANINMFGNWTCPASGGGAIFLSSTTPYGLTFSGTAGETQTLTSNGYIFDCPIVKTGSATGTFLLADDLVVTDATSSGTITLLNGVFDSGGNNVTCAEFNYANSSTKALNLGTSTITITSGTNTTGFVGSNSGTTYTSVANSTIVFTTTATSAFSGGQGTGAGNQFGTVTMSGLGGTLYLGTDTGATVARCITLNNTVSPCTITNACTTAFTVTNFDLNGTAGNLVTFNSNVPGTARTITKATGTVTAYFVDISDSTATGGATFNAVYSTNSGGNTGWLFGAVSQLYRLTNTGTFYTNTAELDETTQTAISMSEPVFYAADLDEVTTIPVAMRQLDTETVIVQTEFDEVTIVT